MARLLPKNTGLILILILFSYFLYYKELPPFTLENKRKIKEFLSKWGIRQSSTISDDEKEGTLPEPKDFDQLPTGDQEKILKQLQNTFPSEKIRAIFKQSLPLGTPFFDPKVPNTDEGIRRTFYQELYKQIYLPYQKYPFLYNNAYVDSTRNTPNERDIVTVRDPAGIVQNFRPILRFGDVPQFETPDLGEYWSQFGLFPPGGDSGDFFNYFDPSDPRNFLNAYGFNPYSPDSKYLVKIGGMSRINAMKSALRSRFNQFTPEPEPEGTMRVLSYNESRGRHMPEGEIIRKNKLLVSNVV